MYATSAMVLLKLSTERNGDERKGEEERKEKRWKGRGKNAQSCGTSNAYRDSQSILQHASPSALRVSDDGEKGAVAKGVFPVLLWEQWDSRRHGSTSEYVVAVSASLSRTTHSLVDFVRGVGASD